MIFGKKLIENGLKKGNEYAIILTIWDEGGKRTHVFLQAFCSLFCYNNADRQISCMTACRLDNLSIWQINRHEQEVR